MKKTDALDDDGDGKPDRLVHQILTDFRTVLVVGQNLVDEAVRFSVPVIVKRIGFLSYAFMSTCLSAEIEARSGKRSIEKSSSRIAMWRWY
jgi:hypothetical protein